MATISAQSVLVEPSPASEQPQSEPAETIAASVSVQTLPPTDTLARHILLYSFAAAVVLAISGFIVVTIYLFRYLNHSFMAFDTQSIAQLTGMDLSRMQDILLARAGLWKFILQSCGIIAGVAFGFLGFALFLLGAKGEMDAAFNDSQHQVQLTRMAPGSFVILIGAVLIGLCALHRVELSFTPVTTTITTAGQNGTQTAGGGAMRNPAAGASEDPSVNPNASFFDSAAPAQTSTPRSGTQPQTKGPGK